MKSWIEISSPRLQQNFAAVRAAAGPATEVLAVIKADAYGHGAAICAPVLAAAGAHWLGVTDVEEGIAVRAALGESSTRILVLCGMEPAEAAHLLPHNLTPVLWTAEHLSAVENAARAAGQRIRFHLEIDTGMSRQGIAPGPALHALAQRVNSSPWLLCEGVMTHLACAEVHASAATAVARQRFSDAVDTVRAASILPEFLHLANSSALDEAATTSWLQTLAADAAAQPMARTGLAVYGYTLPLVGAAATPLFGPGASPVLQPNLQPVLSWKTRIIGLREVSSGTPVGYGATFVAPFFMRLALLPVGYADGFRREASSGIGDGWVLIAGQRAPIVGRVSMNLTIVDVTHIPRPAVGDPVVLLGEGVTAADHARWCGAIPYEILCGLRGHRILVPTQ